MKACCVLHNFVRRRDGYKFEDTLSNSLEEISVNRNGVGARSQGIDVRSYVSDYFMDAGSVPFQCRFG